MTIKSLLIENIRGIDRLNITDEILKYRPNIMVAPNGFGKTSIATAFKSAIDQTSIELKKEDRHEHSESKKAKIEITLEEQGTLSTFGVEEKAHSNNIRKHFDIHVISDLRKIKATTPWTPSGQAKPKGKVVIEPIVICPTVRQVNSPFKKTMFHNVLGKHKNALPDIGSKVFASRDFAMRSAEFIQKISVLLKPKCRAEIEKIVEQLAGHAGTTDEALSDISINIKELFKKPSFGDVLSIIEATTSLDVDDRFLSIWQILKILESGAGTLESHLEWRRYSEIKKSLEDGLNKLSSSSWKLPTLKETKGKLVVEMPDPAHISNGQRDTLVLLTLLHIARYNLTKSKAILIVDEVFDYLDDANLTVAQYYISQLVEDYKQQGRSIYIILLTHLNPAFFRNYVFSNQKVIYLDKSAACNPTDAMKKLLNARSDNKYTQGLKDQIAKYLVHYHVEEYDFTQDLNTVAGTRPSWGKFGKFQEFLCEEYKKYCADQPYDPLAICAITRRSIEEQAFIQISSAPDAGDFFTTYKTAPKLNFAAQRGAIIPETNYLLRVIFDDGLHWNHDRDNMIPIVAKLSHPIIKNMILEAVN